MIGSRIGHYKIIDVLGEGGMGIVYKAFDVKLERYVALKILNSQALNTPQFVERFKREAKNQAKLNHPNIVPVYGFTEEDNLLGIVMEYVEGETLDQLIERKGRLNLLESLKILQQILRGTGYAHSKGFVHRDIKPSNIILNLEGEAKIMDFGISKSLSDTKGITRMGTKLGTVLYMSPEQIKALEPTQQSDIYSIGITFYEMLSGKNPFDIGTDYQIMEAHLKMNPPRLSTMVGNLGNEVDEVLSSAMHKSTKKRYQSTEQFLADVERLIEILEAPLEKRKSKVRTKAGQKNKTSPVNSKLSTQYNGTKISGLRFYIFAFFFIVMFTGLILFIYDAIAGYWQNTSDTGKKNSSSEISNYSAHLNTILNGKWNVAATETKAQINALAFTDDSIAFACGLNGTFLKTTNGGASWISLIDTADEKSSINFYDVQAVSPAVILIAGDSGNLLSYNPFLNEFEKINIPSGESLFDIYFLKNTGTGFIAGANGNILKSQDYGKTWQRIVSSTQQLLYEINFADQNNGFIAGWNGIVLKTTDRGNTWQKVEKFTDKYLRSIFFLDEENGLTAGGGGEIFRSDDGGETWELIKSGTISGLSKIYFFDSSNGIILGSKGEILISEDAGESWKNISSGQFAGLTNLTISPSQKIFLTGQNGVILSEPD